MSEKSKLEPVLLDGCENVFFWKIALLEMIIILLVPPAHVWQSIFHQAKLFSENP